MSPQSAKTAFQSHFHRVISTQHIVPALALSFFIAACSSSSPSTEVAGPALNDPTTSQFDPLSSQATYQITVENYWGADNFPQGFPGDAHLSLWGGATHNAAVSFWELGETASKGIEDMAEAGLIDIFTTDEVGAAIVQGTADSSIAIRRYTDPQVDGVPGQIQFEVVMNKNYPLVSLVSMLGPSPDWFVGISGQNMLADDAWLSALTIDLALYDGGTKSDITPTMGGPDIIPANPIGFVYYDAITGTYADTNTPQFVAQMQFKRIK